LVLGSWYLVLGSWYLVLGTWFWNVHTGRTAAYQADYVRFLVYSVASNDETIFHLEDLHETGSLTDKALYNNLHNQANHLGKILSQFIKGIEGWN
jgi:four helix bundle protein